MKVALLAPADGPGSGLGRRYARDLGAGLARRGHTARLVAPSGNLPERLVERRLARRWHEAHLTHVPVAHRSLARFDPDVAVAFHAAGALAATRWSSESGRPAVFCYLGMPHRRVLAGRRGRLAIFSAVIEGGTTPVAPNESAKSEFRRWLGVEVHVIHPPFELAADAPTTAQACRARAEDFSLDRCLDAHLALYARLQHERAVAPRPAQHHDQLGGVDQ